MSDKYQAERMGQDHKREKKGKKHWGETNIKT